MYTLKSDNDIMSLNYSEKLKTLAFFDSEGTLSIVVKDFITEKDLFSAEKKIENLEIDNKVSKFDRELEDVLSQDEKIETKAKDEDMKVDQPQDPTKEVVNFYGDDYEEPEKAESNADLLIGARPQAPMMSGNVLEPESNEYRILSWNTIGSVSVREEMGMKCVEIEFADKTFHKNLITEDDINTEIATLGYNGAFLASRGEAIDLDQYEDDTNQQKYISQLKFVPFTSWNSIRPWSYSLPKGENADCLAIGSTWC